MIMILERSVPNGDTLCVEVPGFWCLTLEYRMHLLHTYVQVLQR